MNSAHLRSGWRRLACECSDQKLSHALEELAVDLAAKAAELNRWFERYPANSAQSVNVNPNS